MNVGTTAEFEPDPASHRHSIISAAFAFALLTCIVPARATDSHDYGGNEYVIIRARSCG
jgi:hypothetical protein